MLKQIVGSSFQMRRLHELMLRVASTAASVLILGESGTGKELVAKAIHDLSPRAGRSFIPINCAAIPKELLESELFGHKKGSFSGAIADRKGRFELADGGTIFLDEIGDMPLEMQAKLLRVLQEGIVDSIGGARSFSVDVRILAATHRNLEAECAAGRFREDLFHRLNVVPIAVPPLRERGADIEELTRYFSRIYAQTNHAPISLDAALIKAFSDYAWPGNVRELSNVVHRFSVLYPGQRICAEGVAPELLPSKMPIDLSAVTASCESDTAAESLNSQGLSAPSAPFEEQEIHRDEGNTNPVEEVLCMANGGGFFDGARLPLKDYLASIERRIIQQALAKTGGNVSRTAQLLNVQRTTLIQKLQKLRVEMSTSGG